MRLVEDVLFSYEDPFLVVVRVTSHTLQGSDIGCQIIYKPIYQGVEVV